MRSTTYVFLNNKGDLQVSPHTHTHFLGPRLLELSLHARTQIEIVWINRCWALTTVNLFNNSFRRYKTRKNFPYWNYWYRCEWVKTLGEVLIPSFLSMRTFVGSGGGGGGRESFRTGHTWLPKPSRPKILTGLRSFWSHMINNSPSTVTVTPPWGQQ